MDKVTLFCFPYAGGSSTIYHDWNSRLSDQIDIVPVEFPGKGKRFGEELIDSIEGLVNEAFEIIKNDIRGTYGLFGHSMGGIIAYELAHKIWDSNIKPPKYLFISGSKPPHLEYYEDKIHKLPKREFIKELVKIGGTPKEIYENEELMDMFLPVLRNDFRLVEEYRYVKKPRLEIETAVFYGDEDEIRKDEIMEWGLHTKTKIDTFEITGDHFFIEKSRIEVINIINNYFAKLGNS